MSSKRFSFRSRYAKMGITIFVSGAALVLCFFLLNNLSDVGSFLSKINGILTPFYLGIIMAYLLCPIYNGSLRLIYKGIKDKFKNNVKSYTFARFVATLVAIFVLIFVISSLLMLVIPDLIDSIAGLVRGLPDTADRISKWVQDNVEQNPELVELLQGRIESFSDTFFKWAQTNIIPGAESILASVSVGVKGTIGGVVDVLVALVICVYILNSKEIFQAQAKKFILAAFSRKKADEIFEFGRICNDTFGGFINGKIIDSVIIGILCFIAMTILGLPLAMLVSVIVGVTNIIPFFGPFIGAIPSGILLLWRDPWSALKFAIMIRVLQQLDGNIIGPKILGKTTKLASFWVMFAIIVGGGMFGFVGMILGVPTMAIIYVYMKRLINNRLSSKHLPVGTEVYEDFSKYNINKEDIFGKKSCISYTATEEKTAGEK